MKNNQFMQTLFKLLFLTSVAVFSSHAAALTHVDGSNPYEDIEASIIPIEQAPKTILGQDFKYPAGQPLIKAFDILIPAGKQTSIHKHAIPLFIYVVSGDLEVDYGSKGKKIFKPGTSYIEAIEWCHVGKVAGKNPVKIIGIYLGEQNPDQIKPESCAKLN